MPRHVRKKGRPNYSKRTYAGKTKHLNCKMLLLDIQAKETLEKMASSKSNERVNRNILL